MEQATIDVIQSLSDCLDDLVKRTSEVASELKYLLDLGFNITKDYSESELEEYNKIVEFLDVLIKMGL